MQTAEQAAALRVTGCHAGQGFHFARPLEPAVLAAVLAALPSQAAAPRPDTSSPYPPIGHPPPTIPPRSPGLDALEALERAFAPG